MASIPPFLEEDDEELDDVELEGADEADDVEDTPDGGAIVRLPEDEKPGDSEFYANLAEEMDEGVLDHIATEYIELIERDKEARTLRDKQYEEGIRRTGLGEDAPGGAQFQGASKVVHPMLVEACVDFAARAMKELWPANGPCKTKIEGEETPERIEKAERKANLMNWQLTVQAQEARAEVEQLLTQVPLGGAQYLKMGWDHKRNRPTFLAVMIDDVFLPFAATNFYSAQRKTHRQFITKLEYEQRVRSGMYRDVDLAPTGMTIEQSASGTASDKIEGRSETTYNEDGLREVYETFLVSDIEAEEENEDDEEDFEPRPYIVTIDKTTSKVLAIYRNWEEDDESREELVWMVEFPFIPWRGAYPIGLPHMIGGLAGASTGALRALLDSAHIQNTPSGLKLKGGTRGGQSVTAQPTEILEVEGGLNVDDIRKLFMPMPFNPPSPVLFQLLGFLTDAGKGVVRTSMEDLPDTSAQQPVGTTLARIEQGLVVFSAIHGRLHDAMARMLRVLDRFNGLYLDERDLKHEVGELATRKDFDGAMDVVPVSDPNIYSEAQRFAQVQAVSERAVAVPGIYNLRKVEERVLQTLKVPNFEELLMPSMEPEPVNAVAENTSACMGKAIVAFPDQDHTAHLETHLSFMVNPMLGASPMFKDKYLPAMVNHLAEHVALWYLQTTLDLASEVSGIDIKKAGRLHKNEEDNRALDRLLAKAASKVSEKAGDVFAELPPIIEQAQAVIQQNMQPPPMDPANAAIKVAEMRKDTEDKKLQASAANDQGKQGLEGAKLQLAGQQHQDKTMLEAAKLQQGGMAGATKAQADAAKLEQTGEQGQTKAQLDAQKLAQEQQKADADRQADMAKEAMRQDAEDQRQAAELESKERLAADANALEAAKGDAQLADERMGRQHDAAEAEAQRQHGFVEGEVARRHTSAEAEAGREHAKELAKAKPAPAKKPAVKK